jgi:hypothetical protein
MVGPKKLAQNLNLLKIFKIDRKSMQLSFSKTDKIEFLTTNSDKAIIRNLQEDFEDSEIKLVSIYNPLQKFVAKQIHYCARSKRSRIYYGSGLNLC